jgi:hypothetical protein
MPKQIKTREQQRNERAENVCREVRFQMANHGGITDNQTLFDLLKKWMHVAKKNKYKRP